MSERAGIRRKRPGSLALALLLATGGCNGADGTRNGADTVTDPVALMIRSADGRDHGFTVEVAADEFSQQRGLMGRTALAGNGGMLFPFPVPRMASFWMKDTPLPLDLIFIRPDGTIAAILPGQPDDLHPIAAGEPVSAVLEINRGRAAALGLAPGDKVQWGDCARPPARHNVILPTMPWQPDRFCPAGPD
ncbi:MAG TPA: DUF192 domain-containing protein [Sphingobium sp.]|nr:DUF192 domain-containing protein [Sphingobium sp.]